MFSTHIKETQNTIELSTKYLSIAIEKSSGEVASLVNLINGESILAQEADRHFAYLLDTENKPVYPTSAALEDGKLKFAFANGIDALFAVEAQDEYLSLTLLSDIPTTVNGIAFGVLNAEYFWELDNSNSFALSGIAMTTTVNPTYYPGGYEKKTKAYVDSRLGVTTAGSKFAICFSALDGHRELLKIVVDDIDPAKGLTSKHGGPYTYDCPDLFGDYVLLFLGLTPETADHTAQLCHDYSVDQVDMHHGPYTVVQGDFNFVCAATPEEKANNTHIPGALFKERITDKLMAKGVQLGLHTYSSLVWHTSPILMTNPKYQKQIAYNKNTLTVKGNLSATDTVINTYEDATVFKLLNDDVPYYGYYTRYILIDEEIIRVQSDDETGLTEVQRGMLGTTAQPHADGAEIRQFLAYYGGFQPVPLTELFYCVAERTAQAYNEGGFEMIYLDGLESFNKEIFAPEYTHYYIYAEFVRTIVSNCIKPPLIEYSTLYPCTWAARGRGGAIDHARRCYKNMKAAHIESQTKHLKHFYTATVGWYDYAPDTTSKYKDTQIRTMYKDDIDHMGSLALAYDFSTVCQPFSIPDIEGNLRRAEHFMYYGIYSRLRKGNYFSKEVKDKIKKSKYELKVFKKPDGTWAFKEMKYFKNKIFDLNDFSVTAKANNPFDAQTAFVRIEQKYTTLSESKIPVITFDKTKPLSEIAGEHEFETPLDLRDNFAIKVNVCGNGSETDGILLSLKAGGRNDLFIPLNFTGWKELVLVEANNDDYEGYEFEVHRPGSLNDVTQRGNINFTETKSIRVSLCGSCDGAALGEVAAYKPVKTTVKNPSVTVGDSTIVFNTELNTSDYIEYYPELNKAYMSYYSKQSDSNVKSEIDGNAFRGTLTLPEDGKEDPHLKEVSFTGTLTVPSGEFTYTYNAESLTDAPARAQVVIGVSGAVIENPADWKAPNVELPEGIDVIKEY